ncbi:phenylalanyl-tRNA synthetase, alpha subunit [Solidesulfovibrio fructosivorans JJ]]|uniref:Phenylalanine--tRNA ligase alpha subunit n=1 Tax=Solidesulfovibrio fructosivorans JJ] TaxID=596151 RepID=E1K0R1_SOLFR|nr:phenylalanine--tRNA ligase subunit alpha [Solidesulfovibrio fructosivorans]EFL49825.1 phenylalanyl-tRNA synthetase, alpha subunit [Solidesulfovibrio fructosivorans JJ]]
MGSQPTLVAELEGLVGECAARLDQALALEDLEEIRVAYLGRKGRLAALMSQLPGLDPDARRAAGQAANTVKQSLTSLYDGRLAALNRAAQTAALAGFDPTEPGLTPFAGSVHPITLVTAEICKAFGELGFSIVTGPEIETDYYNFEALNMPPEHPARDMQDTLYITDNVVLRTHTSPLQVRTMLARKPPVAVIAPGKVYRRDSDLTHTPMFHQIEGLLVDEGVSMADLRGTLTAFVRRIFGPKTNVRFRPSFFPFTEPSAEVDISCVICGGKGETETGTCRVCKGTGFVEILGCGMVDPNVFAAVGYDTERYTGFAFGMGVERVTMLKYGIGDLRMFFENDIRFLSQF